MRKLGRGRFRRALAWAIVTGCLCLVADPVASAKVLQAPSGFRLRASNGYTLTVLAGLDPHTGQGNVLIYARAQGSAVLYGAPALVSDTSIDANLGQVGAINVDFVPSGEVERVHSSCGGKSVAVNSGSYVGTIDFEGEEGFAEAHATSAPGEIKFLLNLLCAGSGSEGEGGRSPGARLKAHDSHLPRFSFEAWKNSPTRPARFGASIEERRGSMSIVRSVGVKAVPSAFDYDVPAGRATVEPPAPFAGRATYHRTPDGSVSWKGSLSVDLPGRKNVRLTGQGAHASMVRAVKNPSHPFRLP